MAVYELGDRIFHTHFSDNDGQTNAHWRPGKGKIDWSATLVALNDIGYDGVISIELEDVPGRASAQHPVATEAFDRENQYVLRVSRRPGSEAQPQPQPELAVYWRGRMMGCDRAQK